VNLVVNRIVCQHVSSAIVISFINFFSFIIIKIINGKFKPYVSSPVVKMPVRSAVKHLTVLW